MPWRMECVPEWFSVGAVGVVVGAPLLIINAVLVMRLQQHVTGSFAGACAKSILRKRLLYCDVDLAECAHSTMRIT